MIRIRLALRNLLGTGIRLYLNVAVLAVSIVLILFVRGLYAGLGRELMHSMIQTEIAGGQIWAPGFDPRDSLSFDGSAAPLPRELAPLVERGRAVPVLCATATVYTRGRVLPVTLRGTPTDQDLLAIPTPSLPPGAPGAPIPALVGERMHRRLRVGPEESFVLKWRDSRGTFDGQDFRIGARMATNNPRIDAGTLWLPLPRLQEMLACEDCVSYLVVRSPEDLTSLPDEAAGGWQIRSREALTEWVRKLVQEKEKGGAVLFSLLLFLSCLGLFNAQTLSVFQRQREIGVLMALGMRRRQVVGLFTLEGLLTTLLASGLALVLGSPLLYWSATSGIPVAHAETMGAPLPERLAAHYTPELVVVTFLVVFGVTALASWWPTRKISQMEPARALAGRSA